ncbi:MAG: hydantoinase B/oxoprolinase family protein, partial [Chloroflexota bacterium]|nr:hydantoinase B/oxoprolinase family protein [Chloroflexota bacterium]
MANVTLIDREIIRNQLQAITTDMGVTLTKAAQAPEVSEGRDCAVAIVDRSGDVVATDNPLQLGSLAETAASVLDYFKFDMKDGDIVLVSDPYHGGIHVQDFTLLMPLVLDNVIMLYLMARAHMPDIGGQVAGSYFPTATEVWVEGVPITPVKLYRYDRPVRDILTTTLLNSRQPEATRRNLDALVATLEVGKRRMLELIDSYQPRGVQVGMEYTLDYAERFLRSEIASWDEGQFSGERRLDHDCNGESVMVHVTATVGGDQLELDFSRSDDQRGSFINSTRGNTISLALLPLLALLDENVPKNSGLLRAVRIATRPGTVVHARFPAAVGWSHLHCGSEIAEAVAAALRQAVGRPLGTVSVPRIMVSSRASVQDKDRVDFSPWAIGGCGGLADRDGWGLPHSVSRAVLPSVERWESDHGLRIEQMEFVPDSAGAGQWRGAPAVETTITIPSGHLFT